MAASSPGSAVETQQTTHQEQWRDIMTSLYPEALSKTYRVPPEHFFRVPVSRSLVPGTTQPTFLLHMDTAEDSSKDLPTKKKPRKKKKKKKKETEPDQNRNNPSRDFNVSTNQPRALESEANQKHEEESRDYRPDQSHPPDRPWSREQVSSRTESATSDEELLWNVEPEDPNQQDTNVIKSDLQDDFAQNHVLVNLQTLGESNNEVMFIISQLQFKNYGNKPSYAPAASTFSTVFTMNEKYHRGDFDILLIHRTRGILVGELKSVGLGSRTGTKRTLVPRQDEEIAKKLRKAVYQLQKSELVLKHLLEETFSDVTIRKAIFLPYVRTSQLQNVLESDSLLRKDLIACLDVPDSLAVLQVCCCYEQLSNPESHDDVADTLENLKSWWNLVMPESSDPLFPDDGTYLEVVGRFVGPASTVEVHSIVPPHVEVRTLQQAIPEFGRRLQRLVLTPQQLDLMERPQPRVCLSGPPGTGKTVMLVLMALRWLQAGHDVYILSTYPGNLAVSFLMEHQLNVTLKTLTDRGSSSSSSPSAASPPGQVHLKFYDVINDESSVERAVEELKSASVGKTSFHFVMDESKFTTSKLSGVQTRLFQELRACVEDLHFWTACMGNEDIPEGLVHVPLTVPLRCAPRVQSLLGPAMATFKIHSYSTDGVAYYVGDGPPVKELYHTGKGHDSCLWPLDCEQCGVEVARELRALTEQNIPERALPNSPTSLKNKDVFILTRADNLHDDHRDETGNIVTHANGAIRGLRQQGIPVTVLPSRPVSGQLESWLKAVKDAAVAGTNHVIAAHHTIISGLERKVLVFLPGDVGDYDRGVDVARSQARDKLYVLSRCTTKYIKVNVSM